MPVRAPPLPFPLTCGGGERIINHMSSRPSASKNDARPITTGLGFLAASAQIILLREMMVFFYGNELSTGIVLMIWLLWTALGSYGGTLFSGRLSRADGRTRRPALFPGLLAVLGVLAPLTVILVRISKTLLGISQGEIIGIGVTALITLAVLFPFCFTGGLLFPLVTDALADDAASGDAPRIAYLYESAGSVIGGAVTALILIRWFDALAVTFILGAVSLAAAALLLLLKRRIAGGLVAGLLFLFFALQVVAPFPNVDRITRTFQWRGFEVAASEDSIYGNLTVTRSGTQTTLYDNGVLSFSHPDIIASELSVTCPMLIHPDPARVLLVGGGVASSLSEILEYPSVTEVDYVELDPLLIDLAVRSLPPGTTESLTDPRVRVLYTDGRRFIKTIDAVYDVIIINVADPINARINRYYTEEFLKETSRILAPNGVVSLSVGGAEEIISPTLASFLGCMAVTIDRVYPRRTTIPGKRVFFIMGGDEASLTTDPDVLIERMHERGIENLFVTEYYLPYALSAERTAYIDSVIDTAPHTRPNTDTEPIAFLYDMILWSLSFTPRTKLAILELSSVTPGRILTMLGIAAILWLSAIVIGGMMRARRAVAYLSLGPAVLTAGFTEIALEVIIIVAFQTIYGYVYYQVGLIVTAFMAGLAAGSIITGRAGGGGPGGWGRLFIVQICYAVYCLLIILVIGAASNMDPAAVPWRALSACFITLNFIGGVLGGIHFVVASRLVSRIGASPGFSGGWVYGTDLLGSSIGALSATAFLIPILGLPKTAAVVTAVNLCAAVLILCGGVSHRRLVRGKEGSAPAR